MEVILLEKIRNLGELGEKVSVKPGYGRNFLLPYQKAVFATEENIKHFEERRSDLEKKAKQVLAQAEQRAAKLNDITLQITAQASEQGKLYGSIGINEIIDALTGRGVEVSKREVVLPEGSLHSTGEYEVEVHLHSDVIASLKIEITAAK